MFNDEDYLEDNSNGNTTNDRSSHFYIKSDQSPDTSDNSTVEYVVFTSSSTVINHWYQPRVHTYSYEDELERVRKYREHMASFDKKQYGKSYKPHNAIKQSRRMYYPFKWRSKNR